MSRSPMSANTLAMIRELLAYDGRQWGDYSQQELFRICWSAGLLLDEVDRLRDELRDRVIADLRERPGPVDWSHLAQRES